MPAWYPRSVPHHPETRLRLECKSEGGRHGRIMVSAYDGERLVHFQVYFHWHWEGHASGQLLMPRFVEVAEAKAAEPARYAKLVEVTA
ncbi:TPA: hypothetical protein ACQQJB_003645 [Pseudomonas aeruginosa]